MHNASCNWVSSRFGLCHTINELYQSFFLTGPKPPFQLFLIHTRVQLLCSGTAPMWVWFNQTKRRCENALKTMLYERRKLEKKHRHCLTWFLEQQITKALFPRSTCWILHGDRWIWCECVSMIYQVPNRPISNGRRCCRQDAEWLLSTNSSWRAG